MALRKLLTVLSADEREVRKNRNFRAQGFVDVDLPRRIVDVVRAADDMTHLHIPVVYHHGEVIGRDAVAHDDEVIELGVRHGDGAVDGIVPGHGAFIRIAESDDGLYAFGNGASHTVFRTPAAVIARLETGGTLLLAQSVEFFGSGVAIVGAAVREHFVDDFLISSKAVHLIDRTFVIIEIEPLHAVENDLHRFLCGTYLIGILNAQQEFAAEMAGDCPAVDRRSGGSKVHHAGRARRNAGANFLHGCPS